MAENSAKRSRILVMIAALISLVALTVVAFTVPIPYGSLRPGPAFNTLGEFEKSPMIEFGSGVTTYPTSGSLFFTTVSVTRADANMSLLEAIAIYLEPNSRLVPIEVLYPESQTQEQADQMGAAQLDQSKSDAEVAGVRAAGYVVDEWTEVYNVLDDSPAVGIIEPGDRVTKINNVPTKTPNEVVTLIRQLTVGEPVDVTTMRDGIEQTNTFITYATKEEPDIPRVGIGLMSGYDVPIEVDNNVGHTIGGPSAGMMFALAIYDKLTPGALTGGKAIAGTGTIASDGTVGPVGGLEQKMAGAAGQGAKIFLSPAQNCAEALQADNDDLILVKVTKLSDAIEAIKAFASGKTAGLPSCE